MANCSREMSGEHAVSRALIQRLAHGRRTVAVSGARWLSEGEEQLYGVEALQSRILCRRHNEALSSLDTEGARFFTAFERIHQEFSDPAARDVPRVLLFNGHDVERWMLKTLCGALAASWLQLHSDLPAEWEAPSDWLEWLYGMSRPRQGRGLYYRFRIGDVLGMGEEFAMRAVSTAAGVLGLEIQLYHQPFVLAAVDPENDRVGPLVDTRFRPDELVFRMNTSEKVIKFSWDVRGEGGSPVISVRSRDSDEQID